MGRIKQIEGVLQLPAPPAAVAGQGNQGQEGTGVGEGSKVQHQTPHDAGKKAVSPEKIDGRDRADAQGVVIGVQQPGGCGEGQDDYKFCGSLRGAGGKFCEGFFQADQHQKSQKQGEQSVLMEQEKGPAVDGQVKGNLRDQGEKQQIPPIADPAAGVEKPFYQKKAEQRESDPSDQAA